MKRLVFLFLLSGFLDADAQKIQTIVPKQPIIIGNAFQLQYAITNAAEFESMLPPVSDSIQLVSGPNYYKGSMMINGKMQPVLNISFTMVASALGQIKIKSVAANLKNGEVQNTVDVFITVLPQPKASFSARSNYTDMALYAPTNKKDLEKLIDENLFIKTEVDKRSCFIGEPVVAIFKLYSRLQSSSEVINAPSLYGFSVMDMININEAHDAVETIGGKVFNTAVLRKLQLYPEQTGKLIIDEMDLDNEIEFDNSFNGNKTIIQKSLSSNPVVIMVKPLAKIKPADYNGAVGKFMINAKLEAQKINTLEQGKLIVTITGKGNFIQMGQPVVHWPKGFDVFEPTINENLNKSIAPLQGSREYVFNFTVNKANTYIIPALSFSFFDPAADSFKTIRTDSLKLEVVKGEKKSGREVNNVETKVEKKWWIWFAFLILIASSITWWKYGRKKKAAADFIPVQQKTKYTEQVLSMDIYNLSDKMVCIQIQKVLTEVQDENASLTEAQKKELNAIKSDCQLLAYANIDTEGKKEELKRRTIRLLLQIET